MIIWLCLNGRKLYNGVIFVWVNLYLCYYLVGKEAKEGRNILIKKLLSKYYPYLPKFLLKLVATPRNLVVEPIAGCNVMCSACPQDELKRPYGTMSFETFHKIINKAAPKSIGLYFMGEPFLNPELFKMIKYASMSDVKTTVNTNGSTLLRDYERIMNSGLTKIAVSIDGVTQETFEAYRKWINAAEVLAGLKALTMVCSHIEDKPHIQVRTLMFETTKQEIELIDQTITRMGITDHRHIVPIITGWGGKTNPDMDKLGHAGRVKNTKPKICPSLFRMAITWDGFVLPCCNDIHGENKFGNIKYGTWDNIIWDSEMWKKKANRAFKICENCYEDES